MQLNRSNRTGLLTLTITGGMLVSSFGFSYGSLDRKSLNDMSISSIGNFIEKTNEDNYSDMSLRFLFNQKLLAWKHNTKFFSFADQIVNEKNFQGIVSMGKDIVPFILEDIHDKPSPLVWALNFIYDKRITDNPKTTIEQACKLWIKSLS